MPIAETARWNKVGEISVGGTGPVVGGSSLPSNREEEALIAQIGELKDRPQPPPRSRMSGPRVGVSNS
ncbi:hypothetical protein FDG2_2726 [Candidatus Protofrankia californiensis]|uniref:Uncharacterized protein n=1 Tax=Candidatus Protofrankia californiensis TaxID=1839754 RepID=A0A1C3NY88_9ACTN|nr:hypothetical protein FDG2_2726 [Candidatus Protofrankia californiensis]